ncbi:MAG: ornithine cyclodeaminase family protein [Alphaproteobacteria bacterium]|nr:MAG: ornithine cyclodeaminase family protein [Alphaproteobacteria bacterium]
MTAAPHSQSGVLFVPYQETLALLGVEDALAVCEQVYMMHARGSVVLSSPASFKLDVADGFHNHWHVKSVFLKEIPTTGVRLYNYYDDGMRNTVGGLDCTRYIVLSDPHSGAPVAIVDEHWSYAIRSAAAAAIACKWVASKKAKVLGLVGVGTMGTNCLRCLRTMYRFDEIRCTSRRSETRRAFAQRWSKELGIPVLAADSIEEVVRGADIAVGGTTSSDVVSREPWLKPGATFISLARRELDPAGWRNLDKVVIDSWEFNMLQREFKRMVEAGQFARADLYAEIHELVSGAKQGREREDERILIHTTGLVSQDVALADFIYRRALEKGVGLWLPTAQ